MTTDNFSRLRHYERRLREHGLFVLAMRIRDWMMINLGDYPLFDRNPRNPVKSPRQAGYSRWGMLVLLSMLVILGMAPRKGVAMVFEDKHLTGTSMKLPENVFVYDTREKDMPFVFLSIFRKGGMSVWNAFLGWRDRLINDNSFAQKRYPWVFGKPLRVINEFANRNIFYEFIFPAHSPLNLGYVRRGFPEVVDRQSPWLGVVAGFWKTSTSSISSFDSAFLRFAEWSTANDVSTFGTFGGVIDTLHREPSDYYQSTGEENKGKIGNLDFTTQQLLVRIFGLICLVLGLFLLYGEGIIYFFGILLTLTGVSLSIYGPSYWFLCCAP